MNINEANFFSLYLGQRVKSRMTGREGTIAGLIQQGLHPLGRDDHDVYILWDGGELSPTNPAVSLCWHSHTDKVELLNTPKLNLKKIELKTILDNPQYHDNTFLFIYENRKYLSTLNESNGFIYFDTGKEAIPAIHAEIYEFEETNAL